MRIRTVSPTPSMSSQRIAAGRSRVRWPRCTGSPRSRWVTQGRPRRTRSPPRPAIPDAPLREYPGPAQPPHWTGPRSRTRSGAREEQGRRCMRGRTAGTASGFPAQHHPLHPLVRARDAAARPRPCRRSRSARRRARAPPLATLTCELHARRRSGVTASRIRRAWPRPRWAGSVHIPQTWTDAVVVEEPADGDRLRVVARRTPGRVTRRRQSSSVKRLLALEGRAERVGGVGERAQPDVAEGLPVVGPEPPQPHSSSTPRMQAVPTSLNPTRR